MPHINLLPWREEAREFKQNQFLTIIALVVGVSLAVMLAISGYYSSKQDIQNKRNQYLKTEIAVLDTKIEEIKNLKLKRKNLEQRMQLIANLQRNRNLGAQILDELAKIVPPGIYLTKLNKRESEVKVDGKSESNNRISNMIRKIDSSWLLEKADLSRIQAEPATKGAPRLLSDVIMSMSVKQLKRTSSDDKTKAKAKVTPAAPKQEAK